MHRPSDLTREPDSRQWLRLTLVMVLPALWLVAGIVLLPSPR